MRIPALTALVLLVPLALYAAAPPFVPIQGVLADPAGVPINGEIEVRFAIYGGDDQDPALWSETQMVMVENGLFSVYLGQVSALDLSVFRDHPELRLGIQVGADQEMPRIYLGSSPFAGYAEYSGDGGALSDLSCGNWQVIKWNGSEWACANDNDTDTDSLAELSCSTGQVAKYNGGVWSCANDVDTNTDTDTLADLSCNTGQVAKWSGSAWVCGFDLDENDDTLGNLNCTNGQVAKWNGSAWSCGNDIDTDTNTDTLANLSCGAGQVAQRGGGTWQCAQRLTWTSVEITLGSLPFSQGTTDYDIPAAVPSGAREVLVYVWARKGGGASNIATIRWKIYTREGTSTYIKKFQMQSWENAAITYNSDNLWLPITSDRQIHIDQTGGGAGGDSSGEIQVIGYR